MSDPTFTKTQSDTREIIARAFFYQALSVLLRHPKAYDLEKFIKKSEPAFEEALRILEFKQREYVKRSWQGFVAQSKTLTSTEWSDQYENCFGHTANGKVPAYELEYGEEHSHRQPQELADIAAFYQAFGLKPSHQSHERADHISIECEFMYFLLFKESHALQKGEMEHAQTTHEASRRFLEEHLGKWLPAFTFRLAKYTKEGAMKELSDFAYQFILEECDAHGIDVGASDLPIRVIDEKEETGCTTCQFGPGGGSAAGSNGENT